MNKSVLHKVLAKENLYFPLLDITNASNLRKLQKHSSGFVILTSKKGRAKVGHYSLLAFNSHTKEAIYFDSFGKKFERIENKILTEYLYRNNVTSIASSLTKIQKDSSCTCGAFVLFMLLHISDYLYDHPSESLQSSFTSVLHNLLGKTSSELSKRHARNTVLSWLTNRYEKQFSIKTLLFCPK